MIWLRQLKDLLSESFQQPRWKLKRFQRRKSRMPGSPRNLWKPVLSGCNMLTLTAASAVAVRRVRQLHQASPVACLAAESAVDRTVAAVFAQYLPADCRFVDVLKPIRAQT